MIQQFQVFETEHYTNAGPQRSRRLKPTHASLLIWHVLAACYYLCSNFCGAQSLGRDYTLADLTHIFDNNTIYWATERTLTLNVTYNGTAPNQDYWYQKDEIYAATHGGTHLDAPCHFARGRWCVSDIPLDRLVVPAVVVNISSKVNSNPNVHLTEDDLISWEQNHGRISDGSLLLVNTGWSKFWPDPLTYTGTVERVVSQLKFPSISPKAAEWLVSNRNIVGVGIDTMSVDIPNAESSAKSHVILMEKNIYGLENVNILDTMPPKGATVFVMPMKLKSASGAPCRLIAQIPNSASSLSLPLFFIVVAFVTLFTWHKILF